MTYLQSLRAYTNAMTSAVRLMDAGYLESIPEFNSRESSLSEYTERILKLKEEAIEQIRAKIGNVSAHTGADADLKVQAALADAEGGKFDKLKELLNQIKQAKENHESTEALYSRLWSEIDDVYEIEEEVNTGTTRGNTPF